MKKAALVTAFIFAAFSAYAQTPQELAMDEAKALNEAPSNRRSEPEKDSYWKESFSVDLGLNTTQLTNWAAGGYNTLSLKAGFDAKASYARKMMSWNNRLQMDYGFFHSQDKEGLLQKNADRIYFESKWAYKTGQKSKFSYSASLDFRSQFSDTYEKYVQDEGGNWTGTLKSAGISPAYTNIALGIDWVPGKLFNMSIAPLTGGLTICTKEVLRPKYGMPEHENGYGTYLFQFGAQVKTNFKVMVNDALSLESQVVVFTDYLAEPYFRLNWDNIINWKLSKFFSLNIKTWTINDPNVTIDGAKRVQFKDFVVLGFNYTIQSK